VTMLRLSGGGRGSVFQFLRGNRIRGTNSMTAGVIHFFGGSAGAITIVTKENQVSGLKHGRNM
jgi:hypothetical protein